MIATLIITTITLFLSTLFFGVKYFKLKNGLEKYKKIGTGRFGFYTFSNFSGKAKVYINEIDRFTNGYSKISIDHIDSNSNFVYDKAKNNFETLVKTVEIEWLESEDSTKKTRKEKLDKLLKI